MQREVRRSAAAGTLSVSNLPEDTVVYAVIRPAAILARDTKLREAVLTMEKEIDLQKNAGISPSDVEEFRLMAIDLTVPGQRVEIEPVMVVKTTKADAWKPLVSKLINTAQADHLGQKYTRIEQEGGPRGPAFFQGPAFFSTDEKTLIIAPSEAALKTYIGAVKTGGATPPWAEDFKRVEGGDAALAVDVKFFGKIIEAQMKEPRPEAGMMTALAPIWRQTNTLVAGARSMAQSSWKRMRFANRSRGPRKCGQRQRPLACWHRTCCRWHGENWGGTRSRRSWRSCKATCSIRRRSFWLR